MESQPYHRVDLRRQLMEAGIALINQEGYEHLSLRKIAAACQVSHTALYRHFKGKDDLLTAMQQHVEQHFADILRRAATEHKDDDHPIVAFGRAYVQFFADNPQYYAFFTRQQGPEVFISRSGDVTGNYEPFELFRQEAAKHLAQHGVAQRHAGTAMAGMWALVHGLAGMATMPGVHYDGDWGELTERVLRGMEPDE